MTKNSTKLSLVFASAILVVLLALLVFGVWSMRDKNRDAYELTHLVEDASAAEALLQHVRSIRNSSAEDIAILEALILRESGLVALMENIQGTGRALGLETDIVSVSETETSGESDLVQIRIAIETRGSWAGNLSFLRALESLPHRVMMEDTSIRKEDETGWVSHIVLLLYVFN